MLQRLAALGLLLAALIPPARLEAAETISGQACYRFSDNESIAAARDIALSLAKRDALERYAVFVDSTTTVENAALKNDLITSLTGAVFRNLTIADQREDSQGREVCRSIVAEVEPVEVKSQVVAKINAFMIRSANVDTGLPENKLVKILKVEHRPCKETTNSIFREGKCVRIVGQCKAINSYSRDFVRITWYDSDGIPDNSYSEGDRWCRGNVGDIFHVGLPLPPPEFTYSIDLP
jgi:hypothetical protein